MYSLHNRQLISTNVLTVKLYIFFWIELGKEVKKYLDSGSFVPDKTMISLIEKEIEVVGNRNWLLDGEWNIVA